MVAQMAKNLPVVQETGVQALDWEGPGRREHLPTPYGYKSSFLGPFKFPLKHIDLFPRKGMVSKDLSVITIGTG